MHPCPRQFEVSTKTRFHSYWRDDDTCSYCGSLNPDVLFKAIEAGYTIDPTDKNYKIYIHRPNPNADKPAIIASSNAAEAPGDNWIFLTKQNIASLCAGFSKQDYDYAQQWNLDRWVMISKHPPMKQDKFYFQHFTEEECQKFIELYNSRKMKLGYPGRFYVSPFFARRVANER